MAAPSASIPLLAFPENAVINGTLPKFLAQTAVERGPIFRLRTSTEGDFVFMVGPEANRFVMHTHRHHFSHNLGWTPVVGDWLGQGLLNMDGHEHLIHRRMMNPAFTSSYLSAYLPVMQQVVAARSSDWLVRGRIDAQVEAREIAFDVAAVALAGFQAGPQVDRLREIFYALLHGFDDSVETWDQFWQRRTQLLAELDQTLLATIAARRLVPDSEQPRDVLARIVHATADGDQKVSDEQILAHVKILLVAGHETTTSLAGWSLQLLASNQVWRDHVEAELAALNRPADVPLKIEELRSLKSLDLFIREIGRLYSPVLNVPRGVVADFEFGGFLVPAGEQIRLAIAGGHRLPAVFDNPNAFDPARFEEPRDEDARTPYGLVPFGGGPRTCIGMSFAQLEVKALVAHVQRRFRLVPESAAEPAHAGFWTAFAPGGIPLRVLPGNA
ncbi:MAG TPA: cytochrome P450 [Chloroflexota bacterium]|nr:cytochrome P450 [Chloroflexota bacterium]